MLEPLLSKLFKEADEVFTDHYDPKLPLVNQIEAFASSNNITLDPGWKVTLAKQFKTRLIAKSPPTVEKVHTTVWQKLFKRILPPS